MASRSRSAELGRAFHRSAMRRPYSPAFIDRRHVCWLARFDPERHLCDGRYEAAHLISEQQIRNSYVLWGLDEELLLLACYDPRNAIPVCTEHHRRFDGHATPELRVPRSGLDAEAEEFISDWGLESEAERRFDREEKA